MISHLLKDIVPTELAKVSNKVFDVAVKLTPVRTGGLRASWKMSVGDTSHFASEVRGGSVESPLLAPQPLTRKQIGSAKVVVIQNNAHHAEYVENGSPTNRPVGMAYAAVQAGLM